MGERTRTDSEGHVVCLDCEGVDVCFCRVCAKCRASFRLVYRDEPRVLCAECTWAVLADGGPFHGALKALGLTALEAAEIQANLIAHRVVSLNRVSAACMVFIARELPGPWKLLRLTDVELAQGGVRAFAALFARIK